MLLIREVYAGLSEAEFDHCLKVGCYPFNKVLFYCFHRDLAYRIAGRHLVCRILKRYALSLLSSFAHLGKVGRTVGHGS